MESISTLLLSSLLDEELETDMDALVASLGREDKSMVSWSLVGVLDAGMSPALGVLIDDVSDGGVHSRMDDGVSDFWLLDAADGFLLMFTESVDCRVGTLVMVVVDDWMAVDAVVLAEVVASDFISLTMFKNNVARNS